ncbi:MAG: ribosomal protein S18-alanine N-acetyltransferase [Desulfovibrionales bacterium]|nr:ribosomal protein S18-alanine N-acetyltransferase [Desulfovibrionales bacterium]
MNIKLEQIICLEEVHLKELVALEEICFASPWSVDQYQKFLKQDSFRVFGVFSANKLAGYISFYYTLDEAEIVNLAVNPCNRRSGIGKALIAEAIKNCQINQVQNIFLEVRPSNIPALSIYTSLGFEEISRRKHYYPDNNEDALVMLLKLKS